MQLCVVDVRINCWARISVGEAGLGVAWLGWRAAESALGDHPPLPCSMGGAGGAGWPQVKGLEVSSVFSGNLGHFNAFEDDPPGHFLAHGLHQRKAESLLQSLLDLAWPTGSFPQPSRDSGCLQSDTSADFTTFICSSQSGSSLLAILG